MQHGTGREYVTDLLENAVAIVGRMKANTLGARESFDAITEALEVLSQYESIDTPGVYGPDYGFGVEPTLKPYRGPVGSIRDTRPADFGRGRGLPESEQRKPDGR